MNPRHLLAVAAIAVVCGGLAGLLVASIDDGAGGGGGGAVAQLPAARNASGAATPSSIYRADSPGVVTVTDAANAPAQANPFVPQTQQKVQQLGSGFVIDTQGHVITNDHVIAGGSDIRISFGSGRRYTAKVVGADPASDVAVLQANAPRSMLHPVAFAPSTGLQPGDPVYAIGNPFGLDRTMTAGIVSAVGRDIQAPDGRTIPNAIQTDTAINHGSSGGPLLDTSGRVVGVTSQIQGGTVDANVGVGFAVPGETARSVARQLIAHGTASHAWLGVQARTTSKGVAVAKVSSGSPAAKARLVAGRDVIVSLDGRAVRTSTDLAGAVAARRPGDRITLHVVRGGAARDVAITLGNLPAAA